MIKRIWTAGTLAALVLTLAACGNTPTAVTEPAATVVPRAIAELAAPDPTDVPVVEAAPAAPSDESAPCAVGQVKANRKSHIFHAPGQRDYAKVHADVECFDTAAEAKAAGYRAAKR